MPTKQTIRQAVLEELGISSDLEREFGRQASYYADWAFKHARAASRVRKLEERSELIFSKLYSQHKRDHRDAKENDCKAFIRSHQRYKEVMHELRQAQYEADVLKVAVRSFDMRRDMLMQLGAQHRSEYQSSGMSLKAKSDRASRIVRKSFNK